MCPITVIGAANHKLSHRLGDLPLLKGLGLPPEDHGLLPENQLLPPFGGIQPLPEDLPTTTPYWWYPATTTQRPVYRPEVIEVKQNEISKEKTNLISSYHPAASEVLLKFTRWKGPIVEKYPLKDDFVVIEDPFKPEVIEAVV